MVRTTVFDATERKLYERELLDAAQPRAGGARAGRAAARADPRRRAHAPAEPARRRAARRLALHGGDALPARRSSSWRSAATGTTPSSSADDRLGIVVGDVVGRGLQAATAMGQLRSAVRALAAAGFGPGEVLSHLDTFVEQVEPAQYATLAYAEVDRDERRGRLRLRRPPPAGADSAASRSCSSAGARRRSASGAGAAAHRGDVHAGAAARASCSTPTGSSSGGRSRSTTASRGCWPRSARARTRSRPSSSPSCSEADQRRRRRLPARSSGGR